MEDCEQHEHTTIVYVCSLCCEGFSSSEKVEFHKFTHHTDSDHIKDEMCYETLNYSIDIKSEDISKEYPTEVKTEVNNDSDVSVKSDNTTNSGVVPWLAPILPKCPPYLIYGNQMFIRVEFVGNKDVLPTIAQDLNPLQTSQASPHLIDHIGTMQPNVSTEPLNNLQPNSNVPSSASPLPQVPILSQPAPTTSSVDGPPTVYLMADAEGNIYEDKTKGKEKTTLVKTGNTKNKRGSKRYSSESTTSAETTITSIDTNQGRRKKLRKFTPQKAKDTIKMSSSDQEIHTEQPANIHEKASSKKKTGKSNKKSISKSRGEIARNLCSNPIPILPKSSPQTNRSLIQYNSIKKEDDIERPSSSVEGSKTTDQKMQQSLRFQLIPKSNKVINDRETSEQLIKSSSDVKMTELNQVHEESSNPLDVGLSDSNPSGKSGASTSTENVAKQPKISRRYGCTICKSKFYSFESVRKHCLEYHSLINKK